ncbi:MAG: ABC transporter permease [Candidatus Helarchaeota archaeon]
MPLDWFNIGIALISLGFSSLLVILTIVFSKYFRLSLEKEVILGAVQAVIQLIFIGFIITLFFEAGSEYFVMILLCIMIFAAAFIMYRKYRKVKWTFFICLISVVTASSFTLLILFSVNNIIPNEFFQLDIYSLMAFGGIVIGNSMKIGSVAFENFFQEVNKQRELVELKLTLGATRKEALRDSMRNSIYIALLPVLKSLKAIGIVWIPGGMMGMLLAKIDPIWAATYQAIIMFAILCTGIIVSILITKFLSSLLINRNLQIDSQIMEYVKEET